MAMIKCKECGKEISDMAQSCPYCGVVIDRDTFTKEVVASKKVAICLIIVLLVIIGYFFIANYWIPNHTYYKLVNGEYVKEFRLFK